MKITNEIRRRVMHISHSLTSKGNYTQSEALKRAWQIVKGSTMTSKVAGVTFGRRQEAIERLSRYDMEMINVELVRESDNQYDSNAVCVVVSVEGKGSYNMGYIPANIAHIFARLLDKGIEITAKFKAITGKYTEYMNYGLQVDLQVA